MAVQAVYECHCCGWEVSGYRKAELEAEGWEWHAFKGERHGVFVMCDGCSMVFAERRAKAVA